MNIGFKGMLDKIVDISNLKLGIYQSKTKDIAEFGLYSAVAFFAPIFFIHQQIFTGALVNSILIFSALYVKGTKKLIPLMVLPSIGVLSQGFLFGQYSAYLLYMLPFIWAGNAILIFSIKSAYLKNKKHFVSAITYGCALKSIFLFSCAFILFSLGIVPHMFLTIFGLMQFATAFSAGMIIWPINALRLKLTSSTKLSKNY